MRRAWDKHDYHYMIIALQLFHHDIKTAPCPDPENPVTKHEFETFTKETLARVCNVIDDLRDALRNLEADEDYPSA